MTVSLRLRHIRPQLGEGVAMQDADAGAVGLGVELVVVDDVPTLRGGRRVAAEQESAGLVPPPAAALKLADDLSPAPRIAGDAMLRRQQRPYSRFD